MIAKIGWKNIWRKKGRSIIVIFSVAMGIWVGLFFGAFQWGTYVQKLDDLVNRELGHIQIHDKEFIEEEYDYNFPMDSIAEIEQVLKSDTTIKTYVKRAMFSGSLGTLREDAGQVLVYGVDTVQEATIFSLSSMIVEGEMPVGKIKPSILMGKKMAEKLRIKLGQTVNVQGGLLHEPKYFVGRVRGFYESPNKMKDELVVYVHKEDLKRKLGDDFIHEYVLVLNDFEKIKSTKENIQAQLPNHEVLTWGELMPSIEEGIEMMDVFMFVFMMIIWFALALGIINTMLMSVLERTAEFGMLMSIGMSRFNVVKLIFFETGILTFIGVPLGLLLTYLTVGYFGEVGIDLSSVNKSIEDFGYSAIIKPVMKDSFYFQVIFQVIIVVFISSIFPAVKALMLNPVEAVRKR